jgi:hypothetical protein
VLVPGCEPVCVPELDGDVVLEEEELEGDAVVEFVWLVLLDDVLPGVCATTHVAHESSTANSAVLLFISVLRRWIHIYPSASLFALVKASHPVESLSF